MADFVIKPIVFSKIFSFWKIALYLQLHSIYDFRLLHVYIEAYKTYKPLVQW